MVRVLFFVQYSSQGSSSRGIQAGGRILNFNDLCDKDFMQSILKGRYQLLYQVDRKYLTNLKSMQLDEFESIFYPKGYLDNIDCIKHLLGYGEIESPFRKEILEKYGALANKEKPITTIKYKTDNRFIGLDGQNYLYLGYINRMKYMMDYELKKVYSGHLYMPIKSLDAVITKNDVEEFLKRATINYKKFEKFFLKTKKKAIVGTICDTKLTHGLSELDILHFVLPRNMLYSYDRKLIIEYTAEINK